MKSRKTEIHFFTGVDYEKEQEYLRRMHQSGWRIVRIDHSFIYCFETCEPENVIYQLDYYQEGKYSREDYLQMFQDCGWEYLFDSMEYHYFRKPADQMDKAEEIFCDDESRLEMLNRVLKGRIKWLIVIFLLNVVNVAVSFGWYVERWYCYGRKVELGPAASALYISWLLILSIYVVLFIRFALIYHAFKKKAGRS